MMGPYGCLVTKTIHEKQIYKDYIGVDASAVDLIRPAMYGAYHHITVMGQPGGDDKTTAPATDTCDITGNLCENNDKFAIDRMLPEVKSETSSSSTTPAHMDFPWDTTTTEN